jgi:hypothetical protein
MWLFFTKGDTGKIRNMDLGHIMKDSWIKLKNGRKEI